MKSSSHKEQPNTNEIFIKQLVNLQQPTHKQSFYLCLKLTRLFFTEGSVLNNHIKNSQNLRKQSASSKTSKTSKNIQNPITDKKSLFLLQTYKTTISGQSQQLQTSQLLGQVQGTYSASKLYQYPIDITQVNLTTPKPLNIYINNFESQQFQQIVLSMSFLRKDKQQSISLGEIRLDTNIFIMMFIEDNLNCIRDARKLTKRISQKDIPQQVQVQLEVYIQRNRINLERVMNSNKKGIAIADFKQHIRAILQQKENLQRGGNNGKQIQNAPIDPNSQNSLNTNQIQPTKEIPNYNKLRGDASLKYMTYLNRQIQSKLQYFNPKKHTIENQIKRLYEYRKNRKSLENSKLIESSRRVQQNIHKQINNHQNGSYQQNHSKHTQLKSTDQMKISQIIKIIIFVIISAILLKFVMTPSRKVQVQDLESQEQQIEDF